MRGLLPICFLTLSVIPANRAFAGANAGGTLLLHANPSITFTVDATTYCGQSGLTDCQGAVVSVAGTEVTVFYVIAAFPAQASPRLAGVSFGVEYDEANLPLLNHEPCSDFELAGDGWPGSGSGTAVTWNAAQTTPLVEVYWFAAYNYDGGAHVLELAQHPTQGAFFADDSVPSVLDPVTGLGVLGFGAEGSLACPGGAPSGGCCFEDLHCEYITEVACVARGGTYRGDGTDCSGVPCDFVSYGACCRFDGTCGLTENSLCPPERYMGDGVPCDPNPCPFPIEGACCTGTQCRLVDSNRCAWTYHGVFLPGEDCVPNPCEGAPPSGACCRDNGDCSFVTESVCSDLGGEWLGADLPCVPDNPCSETQGACCVLFDCVLAGSYDECGQLGGTFLGYNTVCDPNPCAPVPTRPATWGLIKRQYGD